MNFNKALKVGLGIIAGGVAGYVVYKGVQSGFDVADEQRNELLRQQYEKMQQEEGNSNVMAAVKSVTKETTAITTNGVESETKGSIIRRGLKSAADACMIATTTAQCVSNIADSISRVASLFNNNPSQNNNALCGGGYGYNGGYSGYGYGGYLNQPNYYNNNPMYTGNNQVWNRISPFVVTTGPGINVCGSNNYAI